MTDRARRLIMFTDSGVLQWTRIPDGCRSMVRNAYTATRNGETIAIYEHRDGRLLMTIGTDAVPVPQLQFDLPEIYDAVLRQLGIPDMLDALLK